MILKKKTISENNKQVKLPKLRQYHQISNSFFLIFLTTMKRVDKIIEFKMISEQHDFQFYYSRVDPFNCLQYI